MRVEAMEKGERERERTEWVEKEEWKRKVSEEGE